MGVQANLRDIQSGYLTAATHTLNNTLIEQALDKSLDRTANIDNNMEVDLDMGLHHIINLIEPVQDYDGVNKKYVDDIVFNPVFQNIFVKKSGDTMTGYLRGFEPQVDADFATKRYVDINVGDVLDGKVNRSGDVMLGYLRGLEPLIEEDFTTKNYVDVELAEQDIRQNKFTVYKGGTINEHKTLVLYNVDTETFEDSLPYATDEMFIAARTQNNSSASHALTQLNQLGKIPPNLLSFDSVNVKGIWNPNEPDTETGGPTPPTVAALGDVYYFNAPGPMTLRESGTTPPTTVAVNAGDAMLYIASTEDPSYDGWYFIERSIITTLPAAAVTFNNTGTGYVGEDVQAVLEEIEGTFITNKETGLNRVKGDLTFDYDKAIYSLTQNSDVYNMIGMGEDGALLIGDNTSTSNNDTIITTADRVMFRNATVETVDNQPVHTAITPQGKIYASSLGINNSRPGVGDEVYNSGIIAGEDSFSKGNYLPLLELDVANALRVGTSSNPEAYLSANVTTRLMIAGLEKLRAHVDGVDITGYLAPSAGVRLPNMAAITGKNVAGTDIFLCYIDPTDVVSFGAFDHQDTKIYALNSVQMNVDGVESLTATGAGIDVTGYIKPTGQIYLDNNMGLIGKATDASDLIIAYIDGGNNIGIGQVAGSLAEVIIDSPIQTQVRVAGSPILAVGALGISVTGNASSTVAPTLPEHLTRKDYVDARVVHHATSAAAQAASLADAGVGLHTAPEGF